MYGTSGDLAVRDLPRHQAGEGSSGREGGGGEDGDGKRILWIGERGVAGVVVRVREKKLMRQVQQPNLMEVGNSLWLCGDRLHYIL